MKKSLIGLLVLSVTSVASATNLMDVFQQAQSSDPGYQQAKATYMATRTTLSQARAGLLPNLALTGTWGYGDVRTKTDAGFTPLSASQTNDVDAYSNSVNLTLTQPLFNWAALKGYSQVKYTVKQAAATYATAEQALIMNVAQAYFGVIQQQDVLRYTAAQKAALRRQLAVTQQRYKVGLDAITAVYDARAQYDSMRATYIAAENELANRKEALRQLTGQYYPALATLKTNIPLVAPSPRSIDQWTEAAQQQNSSLQAARYGVQAARENIRVQFGGHMPTLNFQGQLSRSETQHTSNNARQTIEDKSYGLQLNVPLFAGGGVSAQVSQAQYQYQGAVAQMESVHRQVVADVRKAYLGVVATISQIQADRLAIKSARAALASNQAGYKVGTQTILNVLNAQSTLYQAETTYAQDRFNYVINTLTLKQAVGTLNEADVMSVNKWLVSGSPIQVAVKKVAKVKKAATKKKTAPAKKAVAKKATKVKAK